MGKGQSVAEYSLCIGLVAAAIFGMQVLVRTQLANRYKEMMDFTTKNAASSDIFYKPYYVEDKYSVEQTKSTDEIIQPGGVFRRDFNEDEVMVKGTSIRNVE